MYKLLTKDETYGVGFVFDFIASHGTFITLVAQDVFVKVLLVVNLTDNLRKTLGCNRARAVRLHRANAQALSQQKLLIESSCQLSVKKESSR